MAPSDRSAVFVPVNPYLCRPPHACAWHSNVVNSKLHAKHTMVRSVPAGGSPRLTNLRPAGESDKPPLPNFRAECCKRSTPPAPRGPVSPRFATAVVARSALLWHGLPTAPRSRLTRSRRRGRILRLWHGLRPLFRPKVSMCCNDRVACRLRFNGLPHPDTAGRVTFTLPIYLKHLPPLGKVQRNDLRSAERNHVPIRVKKQRVPRIGDRRPIEVWRYETRRRGD